MFGENFKMMWSIFCLVDVEGLKCSLISCWFFYGEICADVFESIFLFVMSWLVSFRVCILEMIFRVSS